MSTNTTKSKKRWGCFPYVVVLVLIGGAISLYPLVTHSPIDYLSLILRVGTFAVLLVVWSPWFSDIRQWHPTIILLPYVGFMLQAMYPILTQQPVDYLSLLLTICTYTLLAMPVSPWYKYIQQRHTFTFPLFVGLCLFVELLSFVLHSGPDYFGLFWLVVGIIVFLFILYVMSKRNSAISTTVAQPPIEQVAQHQNSPSSDEKPTSEFSIFGIPIKAHKRQKSMHIDF